MGILDRLGNVIRSYINYDGDRIFERTASHRRSSDPDLNAAFEELNDYLHGQNGKWDSTAREGEKEKTAQKPVTENIKRAFAELGLTPEASAEECKEAYKRLLKIHHPDRHANHQENMKKATEKTTRVNDAYERLMEWFKGGQKP